MPHTQIKPSCDDKQMKLTALLKPVAPANKKLGPQKVPIDVNLSALRLDPELPPYKWKKVRRYDDMDAKPMGGTSHSYYRRLYAPV